MKGVTFKQLEAISAIARCGSMTAAARSLGVTASALTTRVKELERLTGLELFDRTGSGLRINAAGEILLSLAGRVEAALGAAEATLLDLRGVTAGALVVGITSTAKYFAPRIIAAFAQRHPGVEITLRVGNRLETLEALRRMQLDIAIMGRPPASLDLVSLPFGDHPMIIVGPPDHPLARRRAIPQAEIALEPFLLREAGSGTRTVFEELFPGPVNRNERFGIEIGSNETIKQGVMAGLGIALLSAHTVAFEIETGRLAMLDVEGLPILRKWFVARHADKAVLPAMRAFRDFTLAQGAALLPQLPEITETADL